MPLRARHAALLAALVGGTAPTLRAQPAAVVERPAQYPPRARYHHPHAITARYDAATDKTVLRLERAPIDSQLALSALVALDGAPVRGDAPGVVLTLWSTATTTRFTEDRQVTVTVGDSTRALGRAWPMPTPPAGFREVVLVSLPRETFVEWVIFRHTLLRVGGVPIPIGPGLRDALRDFGSRMAPGTPVGPAAPDR